MPGGRAGPKEIELGRTVIAAATPGPWRARYANDDGRANTFLIVRDGGPGELDDHENNVAVIVPQSRQYKDVGDGLWDENADVIARARVRWPDLIDPAVQLGGRVAAPGREAEA